MDLEKHITVTKGEGRFTAKAGLTRGWGTQRQFQETNLHGDSTLRGHSILTRPAHTLPGKRSWHLSKPGGVGPVGVVLEDCKMALALDWGNLEISRIKKTYIQVEKASLASRLFIPCYFLFLFKNCLARLMKQNKEEGGGELFIGGRKFNLCWHHVTEPNSYLRLSSLNFEWTQNVTVIKTAHGRRQEIMCLVKQAAPARRIYNTSIHWPSFPSASVCVINRYLLTGCADMNSRLVPAQGKHAKKTNLP